MENPPVDLGAWLKENSEPGAALRLTRVDVQALFAEMSRLKQSADRLSKQNRKLRKRFANAKIELGDDAEA